MGNFCLGAYQCDINDLNGGEGVKIVLTQTVAILSLIPSPLVFKHLFHGILQDRGGGGGGVTILANS